jgi:high-affinity nickel-transport protein
MARPALGRMAGYLSTLVALQAAGWGWLLAILAPRYPGMFGFGALAFSLGLRHAFDADHIAAIDNTTRKLLEERTPPEGVGFYFSLGHSTVVAALALVLALAAQAVAGRLPVLREIGALVGTGISGAFLYLIALVNLGVLRRAWRIWRLGPGGKAEIDRVLAGRGLWAGLLRPVTRLVRKPAQMYLVGLLFGLGFDTASEVALLALSAGAATHHIPAYAVLDLPLLFAGGMALMDTADGLLMTSAYGWALDNPAPRVSYNLLATGLSVLVALLVGTVELGQLLGSRLGWDRGVWGLLQALDVEWLGYVIVGLFILTWGVSYAIWRWRQA